MPIVRLPGRGPPAGDKTVIGPPAFQAAGRCNRVAAILFLCRTGQEGGAAMATAIHAPRPQATSEGEPTLRRSVGLPQLTFYGLGGMLGAGIYGLIGKAAGEMGSAIWLAFLVSMVAALLTGLSYACIGSRYPRAAGAAYVTHRAYGWPLLTYVVGLAVMGSGLTSIATQSRVAAENFSRLAGLEAVPLTVLALGFLVLLGGVVLRGIRESMWLNVLCTTVEALGLVLVIGAGVSWWGSANLLELPPAEDGGPGELGVLFVTQAAVLTFFSFIGFEDMLNVSEEVKEPERTVPLALVFAMLAAAAIYGAVAITAVSVVPWQELKDSPGPLTEVMARAAPAFPEVAFVGITVFAVTNTALLNWVMASRLAYGMARQGLLPAPLGRVSGRTRTPHVAILVLFLIVAGLSLLGNIQQLAAATVLLLLVVFVTVNGALVLLLRRERDRPGTFRVPILVPVAGALVCLGMLVARLLEGDWTAPAIAAGLLAGIVALYTVMRPTRPID
jgi:amino acid transporter